MIIIFLPLGVVLAYLLIKNVFGLAGEAAKAFGVLFLLMIGCGVAWLAWQFVSAHLVGLAVIGGIVLFCYIAAHVKT